MGGACSKYGKNEKYIEKWVRNSKGKKPFRRCWQNGRIILKRFLNKWSVYIWITFNCLIKFHVSFCKHGNELPDFKKLKNLLAN